ncbi:MAG: 30S ribosomal protein S15 [Nanoarchaeota archaeon]
MARIYSRKKGKSGSKRPIKRVKPSWVAHDAKVVEQLVVKLAKTGKTAAEIGLILRDSYGIPDVKAITKKRIIQILKDNKLTPNIPYDLKALIRKDIAIMKHLEANKHDMPAHRGLILTESKIHRLIKYYKDKRILPESWAYDRKKAKVLAE